MIAFYYYEDDADEIMRLYWRKVLFIDILYLILFCRINELLASYGGILEWKITLG